MKVSASALLISAALATLASAAPFLSKRCSECTHVDGLARDLIVRESATHYSQIALVHLDGLSNEIQTAQVTSGAEDLPREKEIFNSIVQIKIEDAKRDCAPEALAQAIENVMTSQATFDIPWSKKEEIEKKMTELDRAIMQLMLERIQNRIDAERLSKDCTEKMTETVIAPAPPGPVLPAAPAPAAPETPAAAVPEIPAPAPAAVPEIPAPAPAAVPEIPAPAPAAVPETPAPAPAAPVTPAPAPAVQPGIDVATTTDPKYVCQSGCTDSQDATHVLTIRVNMEKELKSQLSDVSAQQVSKACEEQRPILMETLLSVVAAELNAA